MKILRGYFAREVLAAVAFELAGFLALFTFFDFISELEDIGRGSYQFQHALAYVGLSLPSHIYELMPVATLIGTIYALAQFASNSEFTAMRAAGLSRPKAISALLRVGIFLAVLTAIIGEGIAPPADRLAQDIRLGAMGGKVTGQFRSGIWLRDTVRDESGNTSRQRFVNVAHLSPTGSLRAVRIFEFDTEMRLRSVLHAPNGGFTGVDRWDLKNTSELAIKPDIGAPPTAIRVKRTSLGDHVWTSELTPELISVISIAPDRMSAFDLASYVTHLRQNSQDSTRYELALWKKAIYPIAILVMIALALPFAYMHARAGSIGYKVFAGIMVGVAFHFLNGLFSHIGLLNTWPPWISVSIPSIVALAIALFMLWRVGGVR